MIAQCTEEWTKNAEVWKPIEPGCVHHSINTSLDFQNSQSTINFSTIIPYSDIIIYLSNCEIEPMFLLKVLWNIIIPDVNI